MLTNERKIYLENWLNEHYPSILNKVILRSWRQVYSEEEVVYLYRAYYLPITTVKEASTNLYLKIRLYELPVIKETIDYRFIEVEELLAYLDQVLAPTTDTSKYGKLVRDNIPNIIKNNGEEPVVKKLSDDEYWQALLAKDQEELEEVKSAKSKEEICEELADKLAVLIAMAEYHGLTFFEVEQVEIEKRLSKGGFTRRLYLDKVLPKD